MPVSDFNPHAQAYAELEKRIGVLRSELAELAADLAWTRERTSDSLREAFEGAEAEYWGAIDVLCERREIVEAQRRQALARQIGCTVSALANRPAVQDALMRFVWADASVTRAEASVDLCQDWLDTIGQDRSRYDAFDLKEAKARKSKLLKSAGAAQKEIDALRPEYERIQVVLELLAPDLHASEEREAALLQKRVKVKSLQDDLNSPNPRDRALVHEESERLFGDPSPSRVARKLGDELRAVERDLVKQRRRAESLVRRAMLKISLLVVDGSNLCYQNGRFCGLAPLRAALPAFAQTFSVCIVFDASTHSRLGKPMHTMASELPPSAKLHIVADKADETVLDLANVANAYVLSNDRFADFPDKAAVREKRLIQHEIVGGRVLIHDLYVDVPFA